MKCFSCKYAQVVFIEGKEYVICYKHRGGKLTEPREECPWYEPWEDEEPEWEEEVIDND